MVTSSSKKHDAEEIFQKKFEDEQSDSPPMREFLHPLVDTLSPAPSSSLLGPRPGGDKKKGRLPLVPASLLRLV